MCKYCEKEEIILKMDVISHGSFGWGNTPITAKDIIEDTIGMFIDKRYDKSYLRLAYLDDCQCIEAGVKHEIKYCPFCGAELNEK